LVFCLYMYTSGHALLNLFVCKKATKRDIPLGAVVWGSVFPDIPMFLFYIVAKGLSHASEGQIWGKLYFQANWQLAIDVFHSFPLALLGFFICRLCKFREGRFFFAAMGLHSIQDLLVHANDAHRHFLPFSQFRFFSPISYWDPKYFGLLFTACEISMALLLGIVFIRWGWIQSRKRKIMMILAWLAYLYPISYLIYSFS
jgi:hypothetical protein